jgi:G3E family GTPase
MKLHLVGGFLGSGKTTAITNASKQLKEKGILAGVITNDQGNYLVDSSFAASLDIPKGEVNGGCFCCNYLDLDQQIQQLLENNATKEIFAESVGSCTDLVATVLKPLVNNRNDEIDSISFSVFTDSRLLLKFLKNETVGFTEEVSYIYEKQIEEATILVINKVDLLPESELAELRILAEKAFSDKIILYQNSLDAKSIQVWLNTIENVDKHPKTRVLDIDYQAYGKGEADLAWLDEEIQIEGKKAFDTAVKIIEQINNSLNYQNISIGHLKFLVSNSKSSVKVSFTTVSVPDWKLNLQKLSGNKMVLMVNVRAQTSPENLRDIMLSIVNKIDEEPGIEISEHCVSAFRPGFPAPTLRYVS